MFNKSHTGKKNNPKSLRYYQTQNEHEWMNELLNKWAHPSADLGQFLLLLKTHVDLIVGLAVKLDYIMFSM